MRELELLSPARDYETGRQAILHGADAVYIGPTSHGARRAAANSIDDIRRLVEFAHPYRARVYATVNTVVYERELRNVEKLIKDLYSIGVDALIVQDMGILRLDIPPIELHASTQCDTRTIDKAHFLDNVGFSQIVLARELTLSEIREICSSVRSKVECFIHGALCVSYSGRCHASLACGGRSANRGECAQMCRLPYTLTDACGKQLAKDKYLLSLHDFNATNSLRELVNAGVSSFKIEGRLKSPEYVKNVTAWYRMQLDAIIAENPQKYMRSSVGVSTIDFIPDLNKSFNRGFTDFCLTNRRNANMASVETPKSLGEPINSISELHNGDGISWPSKQGYSGTNVNGIDGKYIVNREGRRITLPAGTRRTYDILWDKKMRGETASRRISIDVELYDNRLEARDERGMFVVVDFAPDISVAKKPAFRRDVFSRLGETIYSLRKFTDNVGETRFIPNSQLTEARRRLISALTQAASSAYKYGRRLSEDECDYPVSELSYMDNVTNTLAESFYRNHGVKKIENGAESSGKNLDNCRVMTSRHCILRQMGMCLNDNPNSGVRLPLTLTSGAYKFRPNFNCKDCEMTLTKL